MGSTRWIAHIQHSTDLDEERITGTGWIRWLGRGGRPEGKPGVERTGLCSLPNVGFIHSI